MDGCACVCRTRHDGHRRIWQSSFFRSWTVTDSPYRLFFSLQPFLSSAIDRSIDRSTCMILTISCPTTKRPRHRESEARRPRRRRRDHNDDVKDFDDEWTDLPAAKYASLSTTKPTDHDRNNSSHNDDNYPSSRRSETQPPLSRQNHGRQTNFILHERECHPPPIIFVVGSIGLVGTVATLMA
jgi:hypothetical protein